jgi:hypothetical protein
MSDHLELARSGIVSGRVRGCLPASVLGCRGRAVSLRRPWANLIVCGHQPVVCRSWSTAFRGVLVIHGGGGWDMAGSILAEDLGVAHRLTEARCPPGLLGTVQLLNVHAAAGCCLPWGGDAEARFHWTLTEPCVFTVPVPAPGRRGLFWMGGRRP